MNILGENSIWVLVLAIVWVLPWKGIALWKSARNSQKIWYIVFFIINSMAVLEILYIFFFQKKSTAKIEQSQK